MAADTLDTALAELLYVAESWEVLRDLLQPGTPLPWGMRRETAEEKAVQARLAREERQDRVEDAFGYSRAPLSITTLDIITDVDTTLASWTRRVRTAANMKPISMDTYEAICWLTKAAPVIRTDRQLVDDLHHDAVRLGSLVRRALREVEPRLPLTDAPCISCGMDTLTLVTPTGKHDDHLRVADAYVVCENPHCEPSSDQCGERRKGHPAWPVEEFDWLGHQIAARAAMKESA